MFEEIRLIDGTANLRIKVKKAFDQSNEVLLDRPDKVFERPNPAD